jgi:hypothetical protein
MVSDSRLKWKSMKMKRPKRKNSFSLKPVWFVIFLIVFIFLIYLLSPKKRTISVNHELYHSCDFPVDMSVPPKQKVTAFLSPQKRFALVLSIFTFCFCAELKNGINSENVSIFVFVTKIHV